CARQGLFAYW
nr:immunoglobulin heavy chain junction region [Mus musculus]NSM05449.1 immunoglobulin heavy chain junction region [Mus musculus]NSM07230.1 immunoglobulin heavy chain junction region [Mus musculus]NSM07424.1 immunoglobulin heavy chain junction region [Mus musculus]NSM08259.1 immunoglobulin heavy chain junction region [Mus musculus]